MKEIKFTKGGWELTLSGGKSSVWCGEHQITREMFFSFPLSKDKDEQLANAHLIKTSPKLYAEIECEIESLLEELEYNCFSMPKRESLLGDIARKESLLAEARGE